MKLPVFAKVREAFAVTARYWDLVAIVAGLHAVFYVAGSYIFVTYTGLLEMLSAGSIDSRALAERSREFNAFSDVFNLAYLILSFLVFAAIATVWHRRFEFGRTAAPASSVVNFDKRRWRVLWQVIKLVLVSIGALILAVAVSIAVGLAIANVIGGDYELESSGLSFRFKSQDLRIGIPTLVAFLVVFFAIVSRVVLILPASALDRKYSLRDSWRHTRRNGTRLSAVLLVMIAVPTVVFMGILIGIFLLVFHPPAPFTVTEIISSAIGAIVAISIYVAISLGLVLSVFSVAYRHLGEDVAALA